MLHKIIKSSLSLYGFFYIISLLSTHFVAIKHMMGSLIRLAGCEEVCVCCFWGREIMVLQASTSRPIGFAS